MNAAVRHLPACTEYRQEFILLPDTLGLGSLVNSLHDRRAIHESRKSILLGPFYRQDSPAFELGQSIAEGCGGQEIGVYALPSIHFDFTLAAAQDSSSGRMGADPAQIVAKPAEIHS